MTTPVCLDTNVVSELLKPEPDERFRARFSECAGGYVLPAPVWHELLFGVARMPPGARRTAIEAGLRGVIEPCVDVLPYDKAAAALHASERARLAAIGRSPPFVDGQIAAIAAVNGLPLVTRNVKDFDGFASLILLDWWAA